MKIILSLFLVFNTSYLFSHPENHARIELVKPFVNSLEQEAHIFGLNLTPNSIMVTKDFIGNPSNQTLLKLKHPSCLLYTSPSPRDGLLSRMPSSA